MNWGSPEYSGEKGGDTHFAFNGITFTVATGDNGSGVEYPASSPDVVSVGGTTLTTDAVGDYGNETAWSESSGGESGAESETSFQPLFPLPQ